MEWMLDKPCNLLFRWSARICKNQTIGLCWKISANFFVHNAERSSIMMSVFQIRQAGALWKRWNYYVSVDLQKTFTRAMVFVFFTCLWTETLESGTLLMPHTLCAKDTSCSIVYATILSRQLKLTAIVSSFWTLRKPNNIFVCLFTETCKFC